MFWGITAASCLLPLFPPMHAVCSNQTNCITQAHCVNQVSMCVPDTNPAPRGIMHHACNERCKHRWFCLLMLCSLAACRRAVLLNLKYNETIASFANAAGVGLGEQLRASATKAKPGGGACTCIAFRTGQPLHACTTDHDSFAYPLTCLPCTPWHPDAPSYPHALHTTEPVLTQHHTHPCPLPHCTPKSTPHSPTPSLTNLHIPLSLRTHAKRCMYSELQLDTCVKQSVLRAQKYA